jgi:hypothetical protein
MLFFHFWPIAIFSACPTGNRGLRERAAMRLTEDLREHPNPIEEQPGLQLSPFPRKRTHLNPVPEMRHGERSFVLILRSENRKTTHPNRLV